MAWAQVMLDQRRERKRGALRTEGEPVPAGRVSPRTVVLGVSLVMLLSLGVTVMFASRYLMPQPRIRWVVRSEPPGAEVVTQDGQVLGTTPWQVLRPQGPGAIQVVLRQKGYKERGIDLSLQQGGERDEHLVALGSPAASGTTTEAQAASGSAQRSGAPSLEVGPAPRERRHRHHRR